jgi:hypothetical protein
MKEGGLNVLAKQVASLILRGEKFNYKILSNNSKACFAFCV